MGFFHVCSDETVTTLKSTGFVAYPVHVMLLKTAMYLQCLAKNQLPLVGRLPAKVETCGESELSSEGRGKWAHY